MKLLHRSVFPHSLTPSASGGDLPSSVARMIDKRRRAKGAHSMPGERVRVGFIGSGGMAQAHLNPEGKGLPTFRDVDVAAFCDVVPAKAEKLAEQYSAKAYSQPKAMFAA